MLRALLLCNFTPLDPLRILILNNRVPWPLNDGGNIATWKVAEALAAQGHTVGMAALNTQKHFIDPAQVPAHFPMHTVPVNTRLTPWGLAAGLLRKQPYNARRFDVPAFHTLLRTLLSSQEFDVIQVEGLYMGQYLETLRRFSRARCVLRAHNVEHEIWERVARNARNPAKKLYLTDMARKIGRMEAVYAHRFDAIVPITERDGEWFRNAGFRGPLHVMPAGVDTTVFYPEPAAPGNRVLFLGSLEWEPNVQGLEWFLREIWPRVRAAVPAAEFHVAGKNPPERVQRLQAPGMVFHGMVPDAAAFLRTGQLFAVPLLSGGGMRLKILEALASGLAVVSTRVGAEGIPSGENPVLQDAPQDFAAALIHLLQEGDARCKAGISGRQTGEAFAWETLTGTLAGFYRTLLP